MPPKGWKKYPDGFKPVNSTGVPLKDKKTFTIEDLLLPRTTVSKLSKEVLPDGSQLPKDGLTALLRSATVFINYLSSEANTVARDSVRKTISANDIYKGLENVGLAGFIPTVQEQVEKYEAYNSQKKKEPKKTGSPTSEIVDLEDDIKSDEEMEYSEPKSEGNKRPKVISASVDKVKKRGRKQGNNKYEDNQGTTTEMDVDDIKPGQEDQDEQQSDELEDERSQAIDGEDEGDEEGEEDEEGEGDEGEDEEEANQKTQDDGEEDEEDEDVVKDLDQEGSVHNESDDDSDNDQNFNVK